MANLLTRQQDQAVSLLRERGMARLSELTKAGVTAATVSRMKARGLILQIRRGLYQLPDAAFDVNHSLAEAVVIEGVRVRIYSPAKTVVDLFRYRRSAGKRYQKSPGLNLALEGLREALRLRKATPSEIARYANEAGVWKIVQPYLEAMTANA
jgi:hypothetical protein